MIPGFDATHAETSAAFDDALSVGALDGLGHPISTKSPPAPGLDALWVCSRAERMETEAGGVSLLWRASGDIGLVREWVSKIDRVSGRASDGTGKVRSWSVMSRPKGPDPLEWVCEAGRPIPVRHAERAGIDWEAHGKTSHHVAPPYVDMPWSSPATVSVSGAAASWSGNASGERASAQRG